MSKNQEQAMASQYFQVRSNRAQAQGKRCFMLFERDVPLSVSLAALVKRGKGYAKFFTCSENEDSQSP